MAATVMGYKSYFSPKNLQNVGPNNSVTAQPGATTMPVIRPVKTPTKTITGTVETIQPTAAAPAETVVATAPAATAPTGFRVGGGYTPDTTLYADKKDKNAVAAQLYDKQLEAYQRALQSAYDAQAASNRNEAQKLKGQYDASRSDVYTNNRLSAIGNNERLAALGLAGNLYDYARSGTSETSRIGQDIAMRKSLAGLDQSENEARGDLALALLMAQKEADANYANKVAEIELAKLPFLQALSRSTGGGGGGGGRSYSSSGSGGSSGSSSGGSDKNTHDSSLPISLSNKDVRDAASPDNYQTRTKQQALLDKAKSKNDIWNRNS